MPECRSCAALERMVGILEAQLTAKDAQLAAKDAQLAAFLSAKPAEAVVPSVPPIAQEPSPLPQITESDLRMQMADFVDGEGEPCILIDGAKVRVDEYQRVRRRLDLELAGGRLA